MIQHAMPREILASDATLEAAATSYAAAKQRVDLKDIPEPVEIAPIDWR